MLDTNVFVDTRQGHIRAAGFVGSIYCWGQGAPIDIARAMAAYKVGAEGGLALCQHEVGFMYGEGRGVAVDHQQARAWFDVAAAQDYPDAVGQLGTMYKLGKGVTRSYRRARELYQRAIELGHSKTAGRRTNHKPNKPNKPFIYSVFRAVNPSSVLLTPV